MKRILLSFLLIFIFETKGGSEVVNPIIITADKVEIVEGMVSYNVISEDEILKDTSNNIADITKTLPNVERAGSIRSSNSEFKIRGMEDTRITTKIDGSKTNFRGEYKGRNFISPFMLSEISVIRGSNSVTEGSGAIAGAVNLKTKDVEDIALNENANYGAELFTSFGTNGEAQNYAGAGFARKDNISLVAIYSVQKNNDFSAPNEKIDYTESLVNNALLKFKKKFNGTEFFQVSSSIFTETGESTSNPFRITNAGYPVDKTLINQRYSAELNLNFLNIKTFFDKTNIDEKIIEGDRKDVTGFESYGINAFSNLKYKDKSFENLFIYGFEFIKDIQTAERPGENRGNIFPDGTFRNEGIYIENVSKFNNFSLLLGARKDYYSLSANGKTITNSSDILKKGVLSYDFYNIFTPFIRYSEGYRSPLVKETFASGNIVEIPNAIPGAPPYFSLNLISNENLKPEYSKNYETGFKLVKENLLEFESETSLNFTYFIQDIKDFIIQDPLCTQATCLLPPPSFVFQYQNLEKVRFEGIELEAKYSSNLYFFSIAVSTLKAYETSNNNYILQTPSNKLVVKAQRKFENGISVGAESISASSVRKNKFREYSLEVSPPFNIFNTDCEGLMLCEQTAGYSILNLNLQHSQKGQNYESLAGISLNNVFNVNYKEQSSFFPGLGRNVSFYIKVKL